MPVLVGFQAVRPASWLVTGDTDATPKSGTFHTREPLPLMLKKDSRQHI